MMMDYPIRCTLLTSVLMISACGGGGSGGTSAIQQPSNPFVTIPEDPATTERAPGNSSNNRPSTDNTGTDSSSSNASNTTNPNNNSGTSSAADDTVENFGPISDLFGRANFAHRFDGNATLFIIDVAFSPSNVTFIDGLGFTITADAQFAFRAEGEDQFTNNGTRPFSCAFFDGSELYFCTSILASGASVNFLFNRIVNGEAVGDFEFCDADLEVDQCNSNLLDSPRGSVFVSVNSSANAPLLIPAATTRLAADQELLSYLQYGHQVSAQTAPINRTGNRSNTNKKAIIRAVSSLRKSTAH